MKQSYAIERIKKWREQGGTINPRYDVCASDIIAIAQSGNSKYDTIFNGFCYGYIQGLKASKAGMKIKAVAK